MSSFIHRHSLTKTGYVAGVNGALIVVLRQVQELLEIQIHSNLLRGSFVKDEQEVPNISALCRIAGVSRSGYYAWLEAAPLRQRHEEQDRADFWLIKAAYEFRVYKKGGRSIYMRLEYYEYRCTGVYPLKPGVSRNPASRGSAPDPNV